MKKFVSKESVLKVAKGFTFTDKTERKQYMDFIEYCIDNAPTAYGLDKVVRELEEAGFPHSLGSVTEILILKNKAIEIVKRGGVDG